MEKVMIEKLKKDLQVAVSQCDVKKIQEICGILGISEEQKKYFDRGLTGYPSVDEVWNNCYRENAKDLANNIPENKTVWDVIEEKLIEYYDIPAIEYFKSSIFKENFIDNVYTWARTFKAMGVEENEIIPVYGPFFPDICAMVFALNTIGACPYFLKLKISREALAEETKEAKIAIVYDEMWPLVAHEFSKDRFEKVMIATPTDAMPSPKKQIVSFLSAIKSRKNKVKIPNDKKYIGFDDAKKMASYYTGDVRVPFVTNRPAFITSSSGTTIGGVVKGTVATNESTISQLYMGDISEIQYYPGDRCLCHFPPTASTALNMLFLVALFKGEIVVLDPRVSENDFYNQLTKLKPNMTISTGSAWEAFFNRVEREMKAGKKFDFSYARGWTVGGEGTDVKKMQKWYDIMKKAHAEHMLYSGYGLSELFSAAAAEKEGNGRYDFSKSIMSVGIPYAGISMGVFDKDGKELPYNTRGELRILSKSAMIGYYGKPELTEKVKTEDGWIKTGDLAEIDERGQIYIWGRISDKLASPNGEIYLFDVANKLKENSYIDDAIVISMPTNENPNNLVAHIVWSKELTKAEKVAVLDNINSQLSTYLPEGVTLSAYSEHDIMLPYSPTTLKKDKNKLAHQTTGYFQTNNGELEIIKFEPSSETTYELKKLSNGNVKKLKI